MPKKIEVVPSVGITEVGQEKFLSDFSSDLLKELNKGEDSPVVMNLDADSDTSDIIGWIPTGSLQVDYMASNRETGGFPAGRIIEIFGSKSCGKTNWGIIISKNVQQMGGFVVYIDAEFTMLTDYLEKMGVNPRKNFLLLQTNCIETIFKKIEYIVDKWKMLNKSIPLLIVWDSVAASAAASYFAGDIDDSQRTAADASVLTKGLKRLTPKIAGKNITVLCLNQIRKVLDMSGGPAARYAPKEKSANSTAAFDHCMTLRIQMKTGNDGDMVTGSRKIVENTVYGEEETIGVVVDAVFVKNKIAPPHRKATFEIRFGHGIVEDEQLFERLMHVKGGISGPEGLLYEASGGQWRSLTVTDTKTNEIVYEKKFRGGDLSVLRRTDEEFEKHIQNMTKLTFVKANRSPLRVVEDVDISDLYDETVPEDN